MRFVYYINNVTTNRSNDIQLDEFAKILFYNFTNFILFLFIAAVYIQTSVKAFYYIVNFALQ